MNFFTQTVFFAAPIYLCLRLGSEAAIVQMFSRSVYRYRHHVHFRTFPPSPVSDPGESPLPPIALELSKHQDRAGKVLF